MFTSAKTDHYTTAPPPGDQERTAEAHCVLEDSLSLSGPFCNRKSNGRGGMAGQPEAEETPQALTHDVTRRRGTEKCGGMGRRRRSGWRVAAVAQMVERVGW